MDRRSLLVKLAPILQANASSMTEDFALNDENWDSVAQLAAIALIDEQYNVTVPTRELTSCTSVGALLQVISRNLEQGST